MNGTDRRAICRVVALLLDSEEELAAVRVRCSQRVLDKIRAVVPDVPLKTTGDRDMVIVDVPLQALRPLITWSGPRTVIAHADYDTALPLYESVYWPLNVMED